MWTLGLGFGIVWWVRGLFGEKMTMRMWGVKQKQCKHKWRVPLMYNKNNYCNPTDCVKCGKMIIDINQNKDEKNN